MKVKALKTFLLAISISLTTVVSAQMTTGNTVENFSGFSKLPENVKTEIKNFNEKKKAINAECKKKRDELKAGLSTEARKVLDEHNARKRAEYKKAKTKRKYVEEASSRS